MIDTMSRCRGVIAVYGGVEPLEYSNKEKSIALAEVQVVPGGRGGSNLPTPPHHHHIHTKESAHVVSTEYIGGGYAQISRWGT